MSRITVDHRLRAIKHARSTIQRAANLGGTMINNDAKIEAGSLLLDLSSQVGAHVVTLIKQDLPKGREAKQKWKADTDRLDQMTDVLNDKIQEVI